LRAFFPRTRPCAARHRHATASPAVGRGAQRKTRAALKWSSGAYSSGASDAVGAAVIVHGSQHLVKLRNTSAQADVFRSSPKSGRWLSTPKNFAANRMLWNFYRADVRFALILLQRERVSQLVLI
jgi:hypothetical protein